MNMQQVVSELSQLIADCTRRFEQFSESEWSDKPNPAKWSRKEVLGHLIDSALNNHRRFVVSQYAPAQNIVYAQDQWVASQNYQQAHTPDLIALWRLLNLQIVRVLEMMPTEAYQHVCDTGKNGPELHSLEWLARDYVEHLRHHFLKL